MTSPLEQAISSHRMGDLAGAERLYTQALALAPADLTAQFFFAGLRLQQGRYAEALAGFDRVIALKPDYAEAHGSRGTALLFLRRFEDSLASFDRALALKPQLLDALITRGGVLRELRRFGAALESYNKAIAIRPHQAELLYNRGIVFLELHRREEALADFSRAIELKADYTDAWINRGGVLHSLGRYDEAISSFDRAIALQPRSVSAHYNRGLALRQQGRFQDAIVGFDAALALLPQYAEALIARGGALRELRRFEEALASYDRALTLRSDAAELYHSRGTILLELSRRVDALSDFSRALVLKPDYVDAWNGQGGTQYALGRFNEALTSFDRAVALKPDFAAAHHNRGLALQRLGRSPDAIVSYNNALAIEPMSAEVWNDRGFALKALRRFTEALASFDRALTIAPGHAGALHNRGATLWDEGRIDEALAAFDHVLTDDPDAPLTLYNRGNLLWERKKRLEPALRDLERVLQLEPDHAYVRGDVMHLKMYGADWRGFEDEVAEITRGVRLGQRVIKPFMFQAVSESPADLQACAKIHAAHEYPAATAVRARTGRRPGKIRVGYVCGEFREHATALLSAGLYENHDKGRFEITAFDNGENDNSLMRRRLETAFDNVIAISALDATQAAERVAAEDIDILVNLNGYYGALRMDLFAHRPAPLQVNYLGFPGTLGAPYIDYIIADRLVIPEEERQFYSEQVVYLPDSYQVNDARRGIPETTATRADFGLPEAAFVYCHFNHTYKITPAIFALWMSILRQTEGSVLWLLQSSEPSADNMRRAAERHGVAAGRLVFAPVIGQQEHMARLRLGDLFLDSQPCNAHTTASDALWMGLPLLTSRGTCFSGRVAASLLHAVGLPELVAETPQAYEALAVRLASDRALLDSLRAKLVANRSTAPLFDTGRFTRNIEAAYQTMFETWQRGGAPESFGVPPLA